MLFFRHINLSWLCFCSILTLEECFFFARNFNKVFVNFSVATDLDATVVGVDVKHESVLFNSVYPGGSSNGITGLFNNAIYSWKTDYSSINPILITGIGQEGITGFAVDWIARELVLFLRNDFLQVYGWKQERLDGYKRAPCCALTYAFCLFISINSSSAPRCSSNTIRCLVHRERLLHQRIQRPHLRRSIPSGWLIPNSLAQNHWRPAARYGG